MGNNHSAVVVALVFVTTTEAFAPPPSFGRAIRRSSQFLYLDPEGPEGAASLEPFQQQALFDEENLLQQRQGPQHEAVVGEEAELLSSQTDGRMTLRSSMDLEALRKELITMSDDAETLRKSLIRLKFKRKAKDAGRAVLNFTFHRKDKEESGGGEKPETTSSSVDQESTATRVSDFKRFEEESQDYWALMETGRDEMGARSASPSVSSKEEKKPLSSILHFRPKDAKTPADWELFQRSLLAARFEQDLKARAATSLTTNDLSSLEEAARFEQDLKARAATSLTTSDLSSLEEAEDLSLEDPKAAPATTFSLTTTNLSLEEDALSTEDLQARAAFALHRSLLEARLEMEAKAKNAVAVMEALSETRVPVLSLLNDKKKGVSFAVQRALLKARLEIDKKAREAAASLEETVVVTKEVPVYQVDSHGVLSLITSPPVEEVESNAEPARARKQTVITPVEEEEVESSSNTEQQQLSNVRARKQKVITPVEEEEVESSSNTEQQQLSYVRARKQEVTERARSSFAFQRALLKSRLELETKARENAVSASVKIPVEEVDSSKVQSLSTPVEEGESNAELSAARARKRALENKYLQRRGVSPSGVDVTDDAVSAALQEEEVESNKVLPLSTPVRRASYVDQLIEEATTVAAEKAEPSYWNRLSPSERSSILTGAITPEKDVAELKEEEDRDIVGFAASRLASGVFNYGKAAVFGLGAVMGAKTEEPLVEATAEATKSVVSAFAAVGAIGLKQIDHGKEYAAASAAKREVAVAEALERRKQTEKERRERAAAEKKLEAERIAAVKIREEERIAAEKKEEEERIAQEMIQEEARIAEAQKNLAALQKNAEEAKRNALEVIRKKIAQKIRIRRKLTLRDAAFAKGLSAVLYYADDLN